MKKKVCDNDCNSCSMKSIRRGRTLTKKEREEIEIARKALSTELTDEEKTRPLMIVKEIIKLMKESQARWWYRYHEDSKHEEGCNYPNCRLKEAEKQFLETVEEQTDTISEQLGALKDVSRIIYKHSPGIFKAIEMEENNAE